MCEKCTPKETCLSYRMSQIDLDKESDPELLIEIKDDGDEFVLDIGAMWFDEGRESTMALRACPVIYYCPWCGRKLEESK